MASNREWEKLSILCFSSLFFLPLVPLPCHFFPKSSTKRSQHFCLDMLVAASRSPRRWRETALHLHIHSSHQEKPSVRNRCGWVGWRYKVTQVAGLVWKLNPGGGEEITVDLGRRTDLWERINGVMGNHPPLDACLKQTVRSPVSLPSINKSFFRLCDIIDRLKWTECRRAGLRKYNPIMSIIKLERSSRDNYELIMIFWAWWPSKAWFGHWLPR